MYCSHVKCPPHRWVLLIGIVAALLPRFALAEEVEITILHTNDIHQELERLPYISGYVADYRQQHPQTVFIDAGDFFDRGSSLVPLTRGETIYAAMSLMGYDLRIIGNHDWAYGGARLLELIAAHPGTVLGTNLSTTQPPLPRNLVRTVIKEFAGIRVGFLGITLDTWGKDPRGRPELFVVGAQEETAKAVAELKPKVDLIVAVTHVGLERMTHETQRTCPTDMELVRANPDLNVIIGGHSHTRIPEAQTRQLYEQTKSIVVQAGALAQWLGRLTLHVDTQTRKIARFDLEQIDTKSLKRADPAVAHYIQQQYDRFLPDAKVVLGQFNGRMEFYNLAYWYADFLREQTGADLVLVPRRSLYDEPASFGPGEVNVERLYGLVNQRYLVRAQVLGRDVLTYCQSEKIRDRFHPLHHQGRPFSGDSIYPSGMDVTYDPATARPQFAIDPDRTYTLIVPWPFDEATARKYRDQLPPREAAAADTIIAGLPLKNVEALPQGARELLTSVGKKDGLKFTRRFTHPHASWKPWQSDFESRLRPPHP